MNNDNIKPLNIGLSPKKKIGVSLTLAEIEYCDSMAETFGITRSKFLSHCIASEYDLSNISDSLDKFDLYINMLVDLKKITNNYELNIQEFRDLHRSIANIIMRNK